MNTDSPKGATPGPAEEPPRKPAEDSADPAPQADPTSATGPSSNPTPRLRSIRRRARSLSRYVDTSTSMDFHGTVYIEGDVVGQNKAPSSAEKEPDRLLVLSMLRPLARPPFVEPPHFASTLEGLRGHDVLCIRGREHTGRRTAAVRALADLQLEVGEVDPRLNLAQIIEASVGGKVGLVLDQSASETLILREYELNRLEEALHRSASKMIIILGPSATLSLPEGIPVLPWPDHAAAHEVAFAWILHHAGSTPPWTSPQQIKERLQAEDVSLSPGEAAILASLAVRSEQADPLEDALHHLVEGRADQVADRMSKLLEACELQDTALLVATLVLSGSPEPIILEAAKRLEDRLGEVFPDAPVNKLPFSRPLGTRVTHLDLHRTSRIEPGLPPAAEPTLALRDPSLSGTILQHIWFEYSLQTTLGEWLSGLLAGASLDVNVQVATAAAQLLSRSPSAILTQLVLPWSISESGEQRFASALCLGLAATTFVTDLSDLLRVVQRLSNASDWRQRWTAITSIGLGVGQRFPRLGLAILDKAGADPDLRVRTQAVTSLHTILDSLMETPEELRDLARLLEWWMGNARHGPIRRALVIAALSSLLDGANGEYDTPEILVEIASVLGQLLRQKDSRHDAQRLVRVTLQRMPTALNRSVLGKIIQGLTPDERGRDRLVFLLRRLQASDDDRVRAAATELMAEIGSAA